MDTYIYSVLFPGIGYAVVVVMIMINTYYNVLNAYALYYMFASITNVLPWATCDNKWNTDKCTNVRCRKLYGCHGNSTTLCCLINQ